MFSSLFLNSVVEIEFVLTSHQCKCFVSQAKFNESSVLIYVHLKHFERPLENELQSLIKRKVWQKIGVRN